MGEWEKGDFNRWRVRESGIWKGGGGKKKNREYEKNYEGCIRD